MKKNLAFISLALACLTAAPLASAATWMYAVGTTSTVMSTESAAWESVNFINSKFCRHDVYAGKYSPANDNSTCASAPKKVGNNWFFDYWLWVAN